MAEPAERRKSRPPQRRTDARASANTETGVRERLRKDSVLFAMGVAFLGFVTWACALTWWVTGAIPPLAVAVASVLPALYLFYLRDG